MAPSRVRVLCAVLLFTLAALPIAARASPALAVDGRFFRDRDGAVVILRGVNLAGNAKVPPFRPLTDAAVFDPLRGWGMNVVRLLFTWEAYEPAPGAYDETYLDYYLSAVDAAASRGLYVIVDFHQDAFSRFSIGGCGDGFPAWVVPPWILRATPRNDAGCGDWGTRMIFDLGMHLSWGAFHRDARGVRTRYLAMLQRVAQRLHGRAAVIGYDIINEPWGDEATELYRLYEHAAVAIRSADPTAILFVSPHALKSGGGRSSLRRPSFGNFAFSPHYYDGLVLLFRTWAGGSLDGPFADMVGVADDWGVPLFVGEFGAPAGTGNGTAYVHALYDGLDRTLASGAQWSFTPAWTAATRDGWNGEDLSIVDHLGATRDNFAARPYPRRIAGTPIDFVVERGAAPAIELEWDHVPAAGVTEIYLPASAMFSGMVAVTVVEGDVACVIGADRVGCASTVPGIKRVRVTRP